MLDEDYTHGTPKPDYFAELASTYVEKSFNACTKTQNYTICNTQNLFLCIAQSDVIGL